MGINSWFDATVAAMPLLWVVPALAAWFCPGLLDAPPDALLCVLAAIVLIFLLGCLVAAMLICDSVDVALSQRQCPFFQETFCAAMLFCVQGGNYVLDFFMVPMDQVMFSDGVHKLLGFFTVPMDKVRFFDGVHKLFGFFTVPMDKVMVHDGMYMLFGFFTVPMDKVMVLDGVHKIFDFFMVPMDKVMLFDGVHKFLGYFMVPMDKVMVFDGVHKFLGYFMVLLDKVMVLDGVRKVFGFFTVLMDKVMALEGVDKVFDCLSVLMDRVLVANDAREFFGFFTALLDYLCAAAAALSGFILQLSIFGSSVANFEKSKRALFFLFWDCMKEGEEEKERKERKKEENKSFEGVSAPALVILQQTAEQRRMSSDVQLEGNRVEDDMVNIMVQRLDGLHSVLKVEQGTQVARIAAELSKSLSIPVSAFYLTRQSKVLHSGESLWMSRDERFVMHGRLRGGMEGDWTCPHCGRQGCWVSRTRCYRCGKSKFDQPAQQQADNGNVPGWIKTQARQQTDREWAQATRGAGVGLGSAGQPLGQRPPQQQQGPNQKNQKSKSQPQSRAPSPHEEDSHEFLLAALSNLIPSALMEQVRSSMPKPEKPLTERLLQVQNKLDEEKRSVNSWREAVKVREAALAEGRKMLSDHVTKVEALETELSSLETQFIAQRRRRRSRKGRRRKIRLRLPRMKWSRCPFRMMWTWRIVLTMGARKGGRSRMGL